jgi:hypothetical protein
MSFFSSKNAPVQYRLIIDIEPNSVGWGLVLPESTKLEYVDRLYIAYDKRPTLKQIQTKLSRVLKDIITNAVPRQLNGGVIASGLCIHASAWSVAETHVIDLTFPKPVKLEEKLVIESVRNHRSGAVSNASQSNLELVYHQVQRVRLNGYPVEHPWGKIIQNISCDLIEGYVDKEMREFCDDILLSHVPHITHVPEAFVSAVASNELELPTKDLLLVHVGGETTEITYVLNDHIQKTASVPTGISPIIREVSESVHGDMNLAFSHVATAARGARIPTKKEQAVIEAEINSWRDAFIEGVHAVCGDNVPEHIVYFSAFHDMKIVEYMLTTDRITAWSNKQHVLVNIFGKKTFQHDFMIAAGALYIVK